MEKIPVWSSQSFCQESEKLLAAVVGVWAWSAVTGVLWVVNHPGEESALTFPPWWQQKYGAITRKDRQKKLNTLQDKNYNAGMISEILYEMNGAWLEFSHWHAENWDSNLENSLKKQAFIMQ